MPRAQNAHAVVNAGFMFKFKQNSNIIEKASIVYGSISPSFIHATKTEEVLVDKDPYTDETLQLALKTLHDEIDPEEAPPEPSAAYRKMLAVSLYYKVSTQKETKTILNTQEINFKYFIQELKRRG